MDYKKIISNKDIRLKILQSLAFIPDKLMIRIQYRIKTGRRLNLRTPSRYTEKIQWYKLNYRKDILTKCSDKYLVRGYVKEMGLEHLLNTLYAVYESPDDIDFDRLPNSFAMKMTVGSGMNYFVEDKQKEGYEKLKKIAKEWFAADSCSYGRDWAYYNIKPRIIFEELLPMDERDDLPDYKFFCFDGKPYCLYTMVDYAKNHENGRLGFFDTQFQKMPYCRKDYKPINEQLPKPHNFEKMLEYAEILSKGFPHVRVDFYDISGRIVFGEMTFYNASGYTTFEPDEFDYILGEKFVLPQDDVIL